MFQICSHSLCVQLCLLHILLRCIFRRSTDFYLRNQPVIKNTEYYSVFTQKTSKFMFSCESIDFFCHKIGIYITMINESITAPWKCPLHIVLRCSILLSFYSLIIGSCRSNLSSKLVFRGEVCCADLSRKTFNEAGQSIFFQFWIKTLRKYLSLFPNGITFLLTSINIGMFFS